MSAVDRPPLERTINLRNAARMLAALAGALTYPDARATVRLPLADFIDEPPAVLLAVDVPHGLSALSSETRLRAAVEALELAVEAAMAGAPA